MADFTADLQGFRPPLSSSSSSSIPFLDNIMEPISHFTTEINNQSILDSSGMNFHNLVPFSNDSLIFSCSHQAPEFAGNLADTFTGIFQQNNGHSNVVPIISNSDQRMVTHGNEGESRKRKAILDVSESSSMNSSPQVSETGIIERKISSRRGKRVKSSEEEEKPKEVVHVRARRGQATDSHSLAERVRRGKINERLRCLQDIVPGCYKTMGMAVMLDEIINYVQSLQNQVEFLSMKLTAASTFYDFNAEPDAMGTMQRAKAQEAKEMERVMRHGCGGLNSFHSTWSI